MSYSKGLEQVRENWQVPPGMDVDAVEQVLPSPQEIIEHVEATGMVDISRKSPFEIVSKTSANLDPTLFETRLQNVKDIDVDMVAQSIGDDDVKKHLKGMLKAMGNGEYSYAIAGNHIRINYFLPNGNSVDMVYDLTTKGGLERTGFLETNLDGEIMDLMKFTPGLNVKFRKLEWYQYLLRPGLIGAAMGISGDNLSIYEGYFKHDSYRKNFPPAMVFAHEHAHKWFDQKYPELSYKSTEYIVGQMGLNVVNVLSVILAIGVNPLYILPSIIASLGTYLSSRDPSTFVGSRAHANLADEAHSDYVQSVVYDYLARKGFGIGFSQEELVNVGNSFAYNYMLGYQPSTWAFIDWARYKLEEKEESTSGVGVQDSHNFALT